MSPGPAHLSHSAAPPHPAQLQRTRDHCPQPHIPAPGWGHPSTRPSTPQPSHIPRPASTVTPPAPHPSQPVSPGLSPPAARNNQEEGYSWGRRGQGPQKAGDGALTPPVSAPFHIPGPPAEGMSMSPSALPALGPPNVRVSPRPPHHNSALHSHPISPPHAPTPTPRWHPHHRKSKSSKVPLNLDLITPSAGAWSLDRPRPVLGNRRIFSCILSCSPPPTSAEPSDSAVLFYSITSQLDIERIVHYT